MQSTKRGPERGRRGSTYLLRRLGERRGNSAIEFALIAPVLFMFTFAIIDFSWYFVAWRSVISSAQVGARSGSRTPMVEGPAEAAVAYAKSALENSYPTGRPNARYFASIENGAHVSIDIEVDFEPLVGFVKGPETLYAHQQMRVEITQ